MKNTHTTTQLIGLFCLAASTLFAQGKNKQAVQGAEFWRNLEKSCGLQTQFSVDMSIEAMGMSMACKLYRHSDKTRTEMTLPFMNLRMAALETKVNGKDVHYSLFPDKKKYVIETDEAPETEADAKVAFKVTEAGTETFEGVSCTKRHVNMTSSTGESQEMDMLFSPAQKNMPVKMTAASKPPAEPGETPMTITSVILFKNYQFAAPSAALFAIPADYTQAASMAEVMMSGNAGGASAAGGMADLLRKAMQNAAKADQ